MAAISSAATLPLVVVVCALCEAGPGVQAVPGSTQYEARSLADQDKENLLTSEAVAQFLDRVWPRWE